MDTNLIKQASKRPTRRRFSDEFKLQIVMQSLMPGASVSALALANSLNANQVFKWRQNYLQQKDKTPVAKTPSLLPVVVITPEDTKAQIPTAPCVASPSGHMDITLRHGQIRIEGEVDTNALRTLVQCMCV